MFDSYNLYFLFLIGLLKTLSYDLNASKFVNINFKNGNFAKFVKPYKS